MTTDQKDKPAVDQEPDYADFYDDREECWNCGGEGFYASCVSEYACVHSDVGCDLCIRTCDVCRGKGAL